MQVKEAVAIARDYLSDLFAAEQISNLGLEEVDFDDTTKSWLVTLGFSRPWNAQGAGALAAALGAPHKRDYKIVRISDSDGRVTSVKSRELTTQQ